MTSTEQETTAEMKKMIGMIPGWMEDMPEGTLKNQRRDRAAA